MLYIMCNIFTQMFEVHSPAFVCIIMMLLKRIRLCLIKCPHTDTHMHTHLLLSPSCLSSPSLLPQRLSELVSPSFHWIKKIMPYITVWPAWTSSSFLQQQQKPDTGPETPIWPFSWPISCSLKHTHTSSCLILLPQTHFLLCFLPFLCGVFLYLCGFSPHTPASCHGYWAILNWLQVWLWVCINKD